MPKVTLYGTAFCPYCIRAKQLLKHKNVAYEEVRVDLDATERGKMEEMSGRTSVPQIFIDDFHVGGCDDLFALEQQGELDQHLGLAAAS